MKKSKKKKTLCLTLIIFSITLFVNVSVCSCCGVSLSDFPRPVMKYKTCNLWIMTPLCLKINFLGAHCQANLFSVLGCPLRWDSRQLSFHILLMGVFLGFSVTRPVCPLDILLKEGGQEYKRIRAPTVLGWLSSVPHGDTEPSLSCPTYYILFSFSVILT